MRIASTIDFNFSIPDEGRHDNARGMATIPDNYFAVISCASRHPGKRDRASQRR
jgi:hypothetical protein